MPVVSACRVSTFRFRSSCLLVALVLCPCLGSVADTDRDGIAYFERKIRPVLVEHCYECHSEGAKKVGAKLLLDSRAAILRGGESGPALVAGKPEASRIIQALRWADELEMPPDDPLPETVVHDFVEWIRRGAPDPRKESKAANTARETEAPNADGSLWSFEPIRDPSLPKVERETWPRDPIDRFVLARMEAENLTPTRDADAERLIRRLYFDLVGLAPTFDEIAAFRVAHARDARKATEDLVDRLLGHSGFGERWGRHWLDVARYGESNGNDGLGRNSTFPHAWRYRNWVIDAFNRDLPYDQFITQQIAGDRLPAKDRRERNGHLVATGFLAIGWKPAVAMNQNFAMDVVDDQINAVSTAVMGLSVACARCHDHKHDPIPTRDYYALAGIFRSTETLYGRAGNEGLTAPATPLHELLPEDTPIREESSVFVLPPAYSAAIDELEPLVHERLDTIPKTLEADKKIGFAKGLFASAEGGRLVSSAVVPADSYSISFWFRNDLPNDARPITTYLFSLGRLGDKKQIGDNFGIGGKHDRSTTGRLFIWNGQGANQSLKGRTVLPPKEWHHVVLVRDGERVRVYLNGETKPEIDGQVKATAPEGRKISLGARNDRFAPLSGGLAEFAAFDRALSAAEALRLHSASGRPKGTRKVRASAVAMGVRDRKKIEDCKINIDGNSKKLGAVVPRGFLSAVKTKAKAASLDAKSSGRLQLAKWLVGDDHPQASRVIVNRMWLHLFGRAIVTTPDDFGVYGARPSHPDLLDHLATRFVRDGRSMKKMIRAIVLSRTYRLSSSPANGEATRRDGDNVWLARHSRRRLDAESLRDRILQASGELDSTLRDGSDIDQLDALINFPPGEAKFLHKPSLRRSVYLCMLRDAMPPELAAFDLPDGLSIVGQREVTTKPTQTLFLLNSPFVVARSQALAKSLLENPERGTSGVGEAERVRVAFRRVLSRNPSTNELESSLAYLREISQALTGTADRDEKAWASLVQGLLATSEFRYID